MRKNFSSSTQISRYTNEFKIGFSANVKVLLLTRLFFIICLAGCCSRPDWVEERFLHLNQDVECINAMAPCLPPKLTLDEIIEIAIENNLDLKVKDKEIDIQIQFAIRDQLKMIPQLIANGEVSQRNNDLIVSSKSVEPGVPPAPPSISTERNVKRYDINLIFNLLEFGLSYYKAEQETKRVNMLALEYERLKQELIVDIFKQYWKAVAAWVAIEDSVPLLMEAIHFQERIERQLADRDIGKVKGLKVMADLINLQVQVALFKEDYANAMSQLTLLMGLTPCTKFELDFDLENGTKVELPDIYELEDTALMKRPELYSRDVEEEIAKDEIRYNFLQMLPGAELFFGDFYDANKYFRHHHWIVAGARATWNLFAIPYRYADVDASKKRQELIRLHRIALSVGVLSQVRLAYILYEENYNQYELLQALEMTSDELLAAALNEMEEGTMSELELIFIGLQTLLAKRNAVIAYGELQISLEQLNRAIGSPRYFK